MYVIFLCCPVFVSLAPTIMKRYEAAYDDEDIDCWRL